LTPLARAERTADVPERPTYSISTSAFSNADLAELVQALDARLAAQSDHGAWTASARTTLAEFARRVQAHSLSPDQESRLITHLGELAAAQPDGPAIVAGPVDLIRSFAVGKV